MPPRVRRTRAATYARRRQRRLAAQTHDLTDDQWFALLEAWEGCAYCGSQAALQKDCMLPISRGGRYTVSNVVPACLSCNASKCNTELTVWMRRKRLDERAFWARQVEIARSLGVTGSTVGSHQDPPGRAEELKAPPHGADTKRRLGAT